MSKLNIKVLVIEKIVPFINWTYFFNAWKLSGKYEGIESLCDCGMCNTLWLHQFANEERAKASEALKLLRDAQELMRQMKKNKWIEIKALYQFFDAKSENEGILLYNKNTSFFLPTLRQQTPNKEGYCLSLCDFISPKSDEVGIFAISVSETSNYKKSDDLYQNMLFQTICDRLVEAASEYLHQKQLKGKGIRPAIGYPSLPDQSVIFDINKWFNLAQIGIQITENGAMEPLSSVCGLYIKHPKSHYFLIQKISEEQLEKYATKRGKTVDEMKKWLLKLI